jgi:eukaryotic-like serine/threonine-protein kinase
METLLQAGRFEVRGTLGAGGAGTVYRAFDRQLQREVALKLLRQASGRDLYRFKREFRALADIVHPNLVALHEMHASGGDWYFTMELVEGVSFIDWVRPGAQAGPHRARADIAESPLDVARLRAALVQLVDALLALHRAGKLHRDLKPSNVLVTRTGRVALLDFGLVVGLAEGNPDRLAVGTPVYMSPEQASDQPLAEASEWYSVGAMLYEALTARRPFEGDSEQVMTRKQTEEPRRPQLLATGVPDMLANLCMSLLSPRPSARPSGAELLAALGAAPSPTTRGISRSYPPSAFVGRAHEIAALRSALADVRRGGVTVLVKGKSGIGKSTLVRRFMREVADAVFVVEGRCFEREAVPFKMLDGVVDSLTAVVLRLLPAEIEAIAPRDLGSLVRMFPVLRRVPRFAELAGNSPAPVDPQELRRRGFRALKATFAKLARLRPLVIFVDDAHWGDVDSTGFLADLLHGSEHGVLVIIAHRPEDYLGIVAQLKRPPGGNARRGDVRDLEITGLSDDDAALLVMQLAQEVQDPRRTDTVIAAGGGNPLVLTEMARAESLDRGMKIEDVVRERMSRLPPDVQSLLAVSSIAARPLPVEIAAHAAGVIGGLDEAAQLVTERLATLREVDGATILHPAHDYVRAAVLASLDTETKAGWHEALAQAFEAVQGEDKLDQQAVVEHWLAAGHPANAAHHAVGAALQAEEHLAFRRAAELYQISLTFGPWDAAGQRDLLRRKAHALVCAGQLDEAAEVFEHAAQLLVDDDSIDLERLRVEALLRRGRLDEALPAAEKLLAQIGMRIPLGGRSSRTKLATQWLTMKLRGLDYVERDVADIPPADLLVIDVLYSITSGLAFADPALGRVVLSELMRSALDAGEPVRVCLALAQEVCYAAAAGSRNRVVVEAVGRRLLSIAGRLAHHELSGFADVAIGIAAFQSGRWRDARGHLESGLQTLRDHGAGVRWEIDVGDTFWLSSLFYLGEWAEMARMTQMLLRDAIDRADLVAQQNLRSGRCVFAWLLLDRADEARTQLDIAERTLREGFHLPHVAAITAAANIALYQQRPAEAGKRLDDAWPMIERLGCLRMQQLRVELGALRARIALADTSRPVDERARFVRDTADELVKEGPSWAAGLGHMLRAGAAALTDAPAVARVELIAAEEQLVAAGMMGFVHIVRLRRARIEGGAVGSARAEAARDFLKDLGAVQPDAMAWHLLPWPS